MMYFLDFDRTLFDTDAFNASLVDEPGCAAFADELRKVTARDRDDTIPGDESRRAAWEKVSGAVRSGALSFAPAALARFLYADVAEILRALGNEAVIITHGEPDRQRAKLASALAGLPRITALYADTAPKADFLAAWPGYTGSPALFVDDRPAELAELAALFPDMRLFEMRRDGGIGDGRWPVIRSLAELP